MKYFQIMTGLRGCYMPDQSYAIACETRRELKDALRSEFDNQRCDDLGAGGFVGLNQKVLAWQAARAWRNGAAIAPFGSLHSRPYAIECHNITRAEYLQQQESDQ